MIFDQKIPKMQRGCSEKIILDRKISLSWRGIRRVKIIKNKGYRLSSFKSKSALFLTYGPAWDKACGLDQEVFVGMANADKGNSSMAWSLQKKRATLGKSSALLNTAEWVSQNRNGFTPDTSVIKKMRASPIPKGAIFFLPLEM
jgi:hypothetical protein